MFSLVAMPAPWQRAWAGTAVGVPVVKVGRPVRRDFSRWIPWFGKAEGVWRIAITSLVPGRVVEVVAPDGAVVNKGALLFRIGGPRVKRRLALLSRRIHALQREISLASRLVAIRRRGVEAGVSRREDLVAAELKLTHLQGDLRSLLEERRAFEAGLSLRAPRAGWFVNRSVSAGQEVEPGAHLADLISPEIRVVARLFPPTGARLAGKKAIIMVEGRPGIRGKVVKVLPIRSSSGAQLVWLEGAGLKDALRSGESVNGWVVLGEEKGVLSVPAAAVVRDEREHPFVLVKTAHGLERRRVRLGMEEDGWYAVLSGLSSTDQVVMEGAYELFHRDFAKSYRPED